MNIEQHQNGGMNCLGQMWTWVSVESSASTSLSGIWANVIQIVANRERLELVRSERLEAK